MAPAHLCCATKLASLKHLRRVCGQVAQERKYCFFIKAYRGQRLATAYAPYCPTPVLCRAYVRDLSSDN